MESRVVVMALMVISLPAVHGVRSADQTVHGYLDRCITSKYHKNKPGREAKPFIHHCQPWANSSCCTVNTTEKIKSDVLLSLHNMVLDQCPDKKNMSQKCREHFEKDTCFYECSANFAPWIVKDTVSKVTRKERLQDVPVCAKDCHDWFEDCKLDWTCNDNWSKNWNWTKKGTPQMCTKPCKTFSDYFQDSKKFCEIIYDHSFKYTADSKGCMKMWPISAADRANNRKIAEKAAQQKLQPSGTKSVIARINVVRSADQTVHGYLDRCITSKYHKNKPGREAKPFIHHCQPWANSSCCTVNTTEKIKSDVLLSLHNMVLDQCPDKKNMSQKCREHFEKDTCFYECSANFAPWIVKDTVSKVTRKERLQDVPVCAKDCHDWFEDCKLDWTCNDNWSKNWNWTKKGTPQMCTKPCKTFSDYFQDSKKFCEIIYDHSFKYTADSKGCMKMWPISAADRANNRKIAEKAAQQKLQPSGTKSVIARINVVFGSIILVIVTVFSHS